MCVTSFVKRYPFSSFYALERDEKMDSLLVSLFFDRFLGRLPPDHIRRHRKERRGRFAVKRVGFIRAEEKGEIKDKGRKREGFTINRVGFV